VVVTDLRIATERPTGIGYDVLRAVPVREILLGELLRGAMMRVEYTKDGNFRAIPVVGKDRQAEALARRLVGWRRP
jgi:hypothetical protein